MRVGEHLGIWNQIAPRDAEALRRVAYIERQFAELLVAREWEPYAPTLQYGVFATRFPGEGRTLWTVVNRNEYDVGGEQIQVRHGRARAITMCGAARKLSHASDGAGGC